MPSRRPASCDVVIIYRATNTFQRIDLRCTETSLICQPEAVLSNAPNTIIGKVRNIRDPCRASSDHCFSSSSTYWAIKCLDPNPPDDPRRLMRNNCLEPPCSWAQTMSNPTRCSLPHGKLAFPTLPFCCCRSHRILREVQTYAVRMKKCV